MLASDGTVVARSRVPHPAARGAGAGRANPVGLANQHHRGGPRAGPAHRDSPRCRYGHALPHRLVARRHRRAVDRGHHLGSPRAGRTHRAAHRRARAFPSASARQSSDAGHRDGSGAPAAADHRTRSRRSGIHIRLRRHLAGAVAHRRARHRPHPGLLHRPDGQHRRLLPLAGGCIAAAGNSTGAAAAGAAVAERARPAAWRLPPRLWACRTGSRCWSDPATHPRPPTRWAPSRAAGRCSSWAPRTWCPMPWPLPDPRAKALQRVDVHAGRWLINGVINGGDALAEGAARLGYGQGDIAVEALVGIAFQTRTRPDGGRAGVHPAHPARTRPALVRRAPHGLARRHP